MGQRTPQKVVNNPGNLVVVICKLQNAKYYLKSLDIQATITVLVC